MIARVRIPRREISEAEFQRQVTDLAEMLGWSWMHIEKMANDRGRWRTPVSGPLGKGFPDLILVKGSRLVFIELKAKRGITSQDQKDRLRELSAVGDCYIFRPGDWALISDVLHS